MRPQSGDVYRADIPPQYRPGTVLYHILANDRWGNEVRDPSSGDYQVQVHSISEPIGGGPAGTEAPGLGVLPAGPPGGSRPALPGAAGAWAAEELEGALSPPETCDAGGSSRHGPAPRLTV